MDRSRQFDEEQFLDTAFGYVLVPASGRNQEMEG